MDVQRAGSPAKGKRSPGPVLACCLLAVAGMISAASAEPSAAGKETATGDPLIDWSPVRTWTSIDGRELRAELLAVEDESVSLKLSSGKTVPVKLDQLVEDDRDFVADWAVLSRFFDLNRKRDRNVSNTAKAGIFDGSFAREGKVHESRNFRFECDAALSGIVVRDFARLFEATYAAIQQHPLALAPAKTERGKVLVRLFANREDYISAGGLENSAGLYNLKEKEILVPLESLGLSRGSSGYRKTSDYDPATLIHETAHALTDHWLDFMPMWFIEGFAEYLAAIPYRDGTLDFNRIDEGIKDRVQKKWARTRQRFYPMKPEEFVPLRKGAFMGQPQPDSEPIDLIPIEPVKIELIPDKPDASVAKNTEPADTAMKPAGVPMKPVPPDGFKPPKPIGGGVRAESDFAVLNRYTSSMLLVHHLFHRESVDDVRKYLFTLLEGLWDRAAYLQEHQEAFVEFKKKVDLQFSEFNQDLARHRAAVREYNAAVTRHRNGEQVQVPDFPDDPVVPEPIPVPEILAKPRSADALSDDGIRERARAYLKIPNSL